MREGLENWLLRYGAERGGIQNLRWIRTNVLLKTLTTFRVGGPASIVIEPPTEADLTDVLASLKKAQITPLLLGRGSNVLACDEGYDGVVIHLSDTMNQIMPDENDPCTVTAQAGASLTALSKYCLRESLTGLEFASGIPGTVGGGLYMNAGAYGGELSKVLVSARVLTQDLTILSIPVNELSMSYRNTRFMHEDWIILSGTFRFTKGDQEAIQEEMRHLNQQRKDKQPLEYPSAGSFFKRPTGYFAGKLIQDADLKGVSVGGAMVSSKHAGFLINTGDATCKDVLDLMHLVQETVYSKFGVELEAEVKYLSKDGFTAFE